MTRELDLNEIAILTRAGPARLLGLKDRGHLGTGGAADIAVYRDQADREAMFARPVWVFKDGRLVAENGRIVATPVGGVHFSEPEYDRGIEKTLAQAARRNGQLGPQRAMIGRDELCACANHGALLPHECKLKAGAA